MKFETIEGPFFYHEEFIIVCELSIFNTSHIFKVNKEYLATASNLEEAYTYLKNLKFNNKLEDIIEN